MSTNRISWISTAAVLAAAWGLSAWYYPSLPDPMPTHWGTDGLPNDYMSRNVGAFLLPVVLSGLVGLLALLPAVSPKGFRISTPVYPNLIAALAAFLLVAHGLALSAAVTPGHRLQHSVLFMAAGGLFIVLGNWLPKFRRNFFVGIRTPWTLADDDNWERTHRLGGKVFVAAGLALILTTALGSPVGVSIGILVVAGLIPAGYSFWIWKQAHTR